jgi:hypothetical protein
MTLAEALAIARHAKPKPRAALDKLAGSDALAKHVAGVTALAKRFDKLGTDISGIQKRLDQILADLDHVENSPGQRRLH